MTIAAQVGNPIGAATLDALIAAEATDETGAEKKTDAIAAVAPVVVAGRRGAVSALSKDSEQFAGLVIEEVVTSMKQTPIVEIGDALLHGLGLA